MKMNRISPCLWFDSQAEEAARLYVSLFERSSILTVTRYGTEGFEHHRRPAGSVMTVAFELEGTTFTALNGGPLFTFSEAISLQVLCDTQAEIDRLWGALCEGGTPSRCGWLKDRFGLAWQVVPAALPTMMSDADPAVIARVTRAFMPMTKLDLATIERAYRGE